MLSPRKTNLFGLSTNSIIFLWSFCTATYSGALWAFDQKSTVKKAPTHSAREIEVCSSISRMTDAEVTLDNSILTIEATCVNDRTGQATTVKHSVFSKFDNLHVSLHSVYASELAAVLETLITFSASGQVALIQRRDSGSCLSIKAISKSKSPVPQRFTSSKKDWRSAIDYMIDRDCTLLAIRLGNRIAIMPTTGTESFNLYNVTFEKTASF